VSFAKFTTRLKTNAANNPLYSNVSGAPFKIGQLVEVRCLVDEQGDPSFLGRRGVIEHLEYCCGCGQSYPHDPMIGVRLSDGRLDEFWKEELRLAKAVSIANLRRRARKP
jgi:hypothetical protein